VYLVGSLVLVALVGCGRVWHAERDAWRREAEVACLKSGAIKEGAGIVQARPIDGPGVCGADHPLKVSALGDPMAALGYTELRPPGAIPGHNPLAAPPPPSGSYPTRPVSQGPASYPARPDPGPQPYPQQTYQAQPYPAQQAYPQQAPSYPQRPGYGQPPDHYPQRTYQAPSGAGPSGGAPGGPMSINPPGVEPEDYDEPGDLADGPEMRQPAPRGAPSSVPAQRPVYGGQPSYPAQPSYPTRPMSPSRVPAPAAAVVEVKPSATLACPIVSQLDQWLATGIQPAAQRWLGSSVVEIKQISAYSCRGMNGQRGAPISEHAFGNALDIASFTLADGRVITVKNGWRGLPEEQGFLRDVHASACERFSTVLAPGSNVYHYDHIHVDLARRASGRRVCNPAAVPGDVVAARAGAGTARVQRREDPYTGSVGARRSQRWSERDERYDGKLPHARAGED
jgi:hypothetical protein